MYDESFDANDGSAGLFSGASQADADAVLARGARSRSAPWWSETPMPAPSAMDTLASRALAADVFGHYSR